MSTLEELAKKLDLRTLCPDGNWIYTWSGISTRDEPVSAEQYLDFATHDLLDGDSDRHLVNALTNAKRALHLRMEDVCVGFGFASYGGPRSFPRMVEYISRVGVTAPRILTRLNQLRNQVEHEYLVPGRAEVETFIDVTSLFAASTQRWISRQPSQIEMSQAVTIEGNTIILRSMTLSWEKGIACLSFSGTDNTNFSQTATTEFRCHSAEFFLCTKLALEGDW
ncbi:hypothetical protein [Cupriavidus pauculus]|uniref:hypothetical protein n=1 Tax=Cupriavidus pauculus TaxID=82633 RepID=UPI001D0C0467|nr:hypothetical protein [Cupriavidus pauculus]